MPQRWALQDSKSPVNLWSLHVIYGPPFLLVRFYGLNRIYTYIYIYTHVVIGLIIFFWGDLPRLYWLHKHVSRSVSILVVEFHVFLSVEEFEKHSTMFFE